MYRVRARETESFHPTCCFCELVEDSQRVNLELFLVSEKSIHQNEKELLNRKGGDKAGADLLLPHLSVCLVAIRVI